MKLWTTQQDYETFVQSANYEEPYVHILSDICDYNQIIATDSTNLPLMNVARTKGWIDSNATFMTKVDASKVTNAQLDGAFNGNTDLITFDEFKYFTNITKIGTSDDVEVSKTTAPFRMCTSLISITLPSTVNELGARAFDQTRNVEVINGLENVHIFGHACLQGTWGENSKQKIDTLRISKLKGTHNFNNLFYTNYPFKHVIIEDNEITELHTGAFFSLYNMESLIIPSNITVIGDYSEDAKPMGIFTGCKNLRRLNSNEDGVMNFQNGVTFLGYQALYCGGSNNVQNYEIHTINIPDSVTVMDKDCLGAYYGLERLNIGSGITEMKRNCIINCGVHKEMITITIRATNPPTWDGRLRTDISRVRVFVPAGSVEAYKAAAGWSQYADNIRPIEQNN